MVAVSTSKREFDRPEVLLGVQPGRLRVADVCTLTRLSRRQVFRLLHGFPRTQHRRRLWSTAQALIRINVGTGGRR